MSETYIVPAVIGAVFTVLWWLLRQKDVQQAAAGPAMAHRAVAGCRRRWFRPGRANRGRSIGGTQGRVWRR